jgi:hypothetical protein
LLVAAPGRAASDDIHFSAALSPENETTPTESPAKGHIDLWLERATLKIRWRVTFQDLSTPLTSAALHGPENAGANAGVLINLGKGRSPLEGSATMSDGQFQYLITTRVYANIVTQKFPAGEIRGHLRRQLASTSAP